jgi:hypothetical protein
VLGQCSAVEIEARPPFRAPAAAALSIGMNRNLRVKTG